MAYKNNKTNVPDVYLKCDRCSMEWLIVLPSDPGHTYYRVHERTGRHICPDCIDYLEEVGKADDWKGTFDGPPA